MVIECNICSNYCKIEDDCFGICRQHKNINNQLIDVGYGVLSSCNIDSIEKKPLYHFLPGSRTYSLGGFGCNMSCLYCQNYNISQNLDNFSSTIKITPEKVVENALLNKCMSIAFTYNEPNIHLSFYEDVASIARRNNIKIVYVSNGYFSKESLSRILKFTDAFNIDLKSINPSFYRKLCAADIEVVLDNIKTIYKSNKHLEITNLLLNNYNDSESEIIKLIDFILENLDSKIPLHFSKAYPYFKMQNLIPTPKEKLFQAREIATSKGMEFVYLGNFPCDNNTYCPNCGKLLIKRNGYSTYSLIKNKCDNCGYDVL